ncbi:MAG: hypothetical protein VX112_04455 [Pseudomonadota bacterium]|nr:hypothetical protein [Pseudomonadota bacterium]
MILTRLIIYLLASFYCVFPSHAKTYSIDRVFPSLDSSFDMQGSKIGYGARFVQGSDAEDHVVLGPTADTTEFHLAFNTEVLEGLTLRAFTKIDPKEGSLENSDETSTIDSDIFFQATQFGVFMISPKHGIGYLGRLKTPTAALAEQTALSSGISEKYFVDVGGVAVVNTSLSQTYRVGQVQIGDDTAPILGGKGVSLWGYGPSDGNRVLDSVGYILPTDKYELRFAYANEDVKNVSPSFEFTVSYLHDLIIAQNNFMFGYATKWPYASKMDMIYVNDASDSDEIWVDEGHKSPYQLAQVANKLSAGDMDIAFSYSSLFGNSGSYSVDSLSKEINQIYFAADYTFVDLIPYGPLTFGLGYVHRTNGFSKVESIHLESPYDTFYNLLDTRIKSGIDYGFTGLDTVYDSVNNGFMLAIHQHLGPRAGMKLYFENLNFTGKITGNNLQQTAAKMKVDSTYYDTLSTTEKTYVDKLATMSSTYDLDISPINAVIFSMYVKI